MSLERVLFKRISTKMTSNQIV